MSVENTIKSFQEGAAYFIPKEEMFNIASYLNDVLEAVEKKKSFWSTWLDQMGFYYNKRFGEDWKDKE